jgi:hypothetical protein
VIHPAGQRLLRSVEQQWQGAASGAVGDHQADPLPVQIGSAERLPDEPLDLIGCQPLTDPAYRASPSRITWVSAMGGWLGGRENRRHMGTVQLARPSGKKFQIHPRHTGNLSPLNR